MTLIKPLAYLAIPLGLANLIVSGLINIFPDFAGTLSEAVPIWGIFALFAISFTAVCYIGWWAYGFFSEHLDPSGQCIAGFVLPVVTAFIATLNWSAFSVIGRLNSQTPDQFLGRFDNFSLAMIFVIFMLGGIIWGILMKTPEYDGKTQEKVAVGYTIMSYCLVL